MIIHKLNPQGFCKGVINAIKLAKAAVTDSSIKKPIYMLGALIHNQHIIDELTKLGIIIIDEKGKTRLELLDLIPNNEGTVIISAHGASDNVYTKIKEKGLDILDATCPYVKLVHNRVKEKLNQGYDVIYIGAKGHPECEGVVTNSNKINLVTSLSDIDKLNISNNNIYVTNQTTLSIYEINNIYDNIKNRYSNAIIDDKICMATTERQKAVYESPMVDLCIVIGDSRSSNTKKLAEVANKKGIKTLLVEDLNDLKKSLPDNINSISITSGASTPDYITNEIIEYLSK